MKDDNRLPEGWSVILGAVLGLSIFAVVVLIILIILIIDKIPHKQTTSVELHEEPIPLEEMLEHDLAFKYAVWEYQQTEVEEVEEPTYLIEVTEEEIELMTRVVMSEVGLKDIDCKQAVAQTIVNRVRDGRWGATVSAVISYPNAYSTQDNGEPNQECHDAVIQALTYESFPLDMFYFREDHYHEFGFPYIHLGTTYFTTEKLAWD